MEDIKRPQVICHMMQTIDGKIASGVADVEILMDYFDTYTNIEHELGGKAWMFGRKTGGAFSEAVNTPLAPTKTLTNDDDFIANFTGDNYAIIVDARGVLRWKENFITLSNQPNPFHLIIIVTKQTPKEYLSYLQNKGISYVISGEGKINFVEVLNKLRKNFKIEKILLEGGGSFNGSLMAADVVDEISLLLIPRILNKKDAPSLFDMETDSVDPKNYELSTLKQLDKGVLWLKYKRI